MPLSVPSEIVQSGELADSEGERDIDVAHACELLFSSLNR